MRRDRTLTDWVLMVALAFLGLLAATTLLTLIENANLHQVIDRLEAEPVVETTGTGGAEVVLPTFEPVAAWQFPLLEADYRQFTSPWGYRTSPFLDIEVWHQGLDVVGVWKAQVVAVADGVVITHYPPPDGYYRGHETYGGMVVIEHDDGIRTLYAHLSWTRVHTGDRVTAGQVIGRMGDTGKADGAHLHIEVTAPDGTLLNPALFIADPEEE